jgi:hypothetical protein
LEVALTTLKFKNIWGFMEMFWDERIRWRS